MPHYAKSEEWLRESQLLLEARPTTTRITTKYAIKTPKQRKPKTDDDTPATTAAPKPARGFLTLKTYDPVSGVTLKYRTSKAAEVSRLIGCLGKLSRPMAGLPEQKDEVMTDAPAEEGTPAAEKSEAAATATTAPAAQQAPAAGGGKGKKKKGKK
ncbi:signal recognition particle 9 kDa protein-domain-containing protein [Apiospora marii]|uniref:signal recognition particle 9 kDa protein-domain-containing protein n=1 Tax=Apiospora marii TaxID=335849 RepID=UPI0031316365